MLRRRLIMKREMDRSFTVGGWCDERTGDRIGDRLAFLLHGGRLARAGIGGKSVKSS